MCSYRQPSVAARSVHLLSGQCAAIPKIPQKIAESETEKNKFAEAIDEL
jgi:hypothetical protein